MKPTLRGTLRALLDVLIPDAEDGSVPGAVKAGVAEHPSLFESEPRVCEILARIDEQAVASTGRPFADLTIPAAEQVVKQNPEIWLECSRLVGPLALRAYFENPRVLAALGLADRPPFPDGFRMDSIDYDLLEPVVERGQKYRDPEREES